MVIVVIDYGAGNLFSIRNAFKKIGVNVEATADAKTIENADALVLPGVGSFGDAMEKLEPLCETIIDFVDSGKPFLGLCLGIQVILSKSDESPQVDGLGLIDGVCHRFEGDGLKVPHMGWNTIDVVRETPLLSGIESGEYFYFVHSFFPKPEDENVVVAKTEYGINFPSVIAKDNVYATQFHPEKSGEAGLRVLENFAGLL